MAKYLYLFRGGDPEDTSPEALQGTMQKWSAWMQGLAQKGHLSDGLPLRPEGHVVEKAGEVVHDGPFAEGSEVVGGYLLINAESLSEAVELSKGCPIYEDGGTTEVRECMDM